MDVRRTKGIKGTLGAFGKARETVLHPQGANTVTTSGQDLVRVALMRDVPDHLVFRRIKNRMKRHCQFHNAKASPQMSTGDGDGRDSLLPQLMRDLLQLRVRETFQIRRRCDLIKERGLWPVGHVGRGSFGARFSCRAR